MDPIFLGQLAVWSHVPEDRKPKARILLVHGISEHSGRYTHLIPYLLSQGFAVVRFDLRGAGRSGGRRQWVKRWEDYIDDTVLVANWISSELDRMPLFLYGHSMGGAISLHFSAIHWRRLQGLILSGPAYLVGGAISPLKIAMGKILGKITPTLPIPAPKVNPAVSRDPAVVRQFAEDPLSYHINTVQQANEVLRGLKEVPERAKAIGCPTFLVHGSADQIIRLEGSFEILQQLGASDREMYVVPGGYHEPHNDFGKEEYFSSLGLWLDRHTPS